MNKFNFWSDFISVVAVTDVAEMEKQEVSKETVESWHVEEQAMEVDISLLRQVEALERKIITASLQVKVQTSYSSDMQLCTFFLVCPHVVMSWVSWVSRVGCILSRSQTVPIWFTMSTNRSPRLWTTNQVREKPAWRSFQAQLSDGPTILLI